METVSVDGPGRKAAYGKDLAFDLEIGMAVYDPNGQKLGTVTAVEGFGANLQGVAPSQGADDRVTQAQSGTGYFKVNREAVLGGGVSDLTIPFRGIQGVTPEHGVTVNGTIIAQLLGQGATDGPQPAG